MLKDWYEISLSKSTNIAYKQEVRLYKSEGETIVWISRQLTQEDIIYV